MIQIGSLTLKSNLFLSPLAGYTNLPFRLTLRELGGLDLASTTATIASKPRPHPSPLLFSIRRF